LDAGSSGELLAKPQRIGALLQRVEIAVHRAEVDDAAVHGRRRHDRADGDEPLKSRLHVLEVAEERAAWPLYGRLRRAFRLARAAVIAIETARVL